MKFSVITPVNLWNEDRVKRFLVTIDSLANQGFKDFEWVIVDDGSTEPFRWEIISEKIENGHIFHKSHEERVIAYNEAFSRATGEWFVLLDSDDELVPSALEKLAKTIDKYPKDRMFNFGCIYEHQDGKKSYRDPFNPARKKKGHVKFGGGNIVNGTFTFHREVYEKLKAYPAANIRNVDCTDINYKTNDGKMVRDLYMGTPYDFSAAAQLMFPEIREYFMVDHENEPNKIIKELGNPWGQDYFLFYKFTRKYYSRILKEYLYIVHPR